MINKLISPFAERGWFANDTHSLTEQISQSIQHEEPQQVSAVIAPHAGYRWCGDVIGHAMRHLSDRYNNVVLIGPSHHARMRNMIITCDYDCVSTPLGDCRVGDAPIGDIWVKNNDIHMNEHSVQMHVPYVQKCCPSASITPLIVGEIDNNTEQIIVDWLLSVYDEQTLIIASSDFTHHGDRFNYTPFDRDVGESVSKFDHLVIDYLLNIEYTKYKSFINNNKNTICGRNAMLLLMNFLQHTQSKSTPHKYLMSGDITKDYSHTVSYAGIDFIS